MAFTATPKAKTLELFGRKGVDGKAVETALDALEAAARSGANIMPVSIAAAKAGVTTGEWGGRLRQVFGEYRAPTGVTVETASSGAAEEARLLIADLGERLGETPKLVVGKPGLDGHSNGAEQIAFRARDCGMDITYDGIRLTPAEIVATVRDEEAHVVGLSILSGSHLPLIEDLARLLIETRIVDEDGFRALHQPPDVGVKVGEGDTAAVVQLADVDAVAHFLTELATARAAHIGHSRGDDA